MVKLFVEPISPIFACCDRLIVAEDVASASRFQREARRVEHLAWRRIVRRELGSEVTISYNDVGAPIVDRPNIYISVAHAKERMVAVAIADRAVGVDIEYIDRDFERVAPRYMSAEEVQLSESGVWYAMVWSAKEAMYKLYGRRGVDLLSDLRVVGYDASEGRISGIVGDGSRVVVDVDIVDESYVVAVATHE
jgi:phosphopantetheinyl transferase